MKRKEPSINAPYEYGWLYALIIMDCETYMKGKRELAICSVKVLGSFGWRPKDRDGGEERGEGRRSMYEDMVLKKKG